MVVMLSEEVHPIIFHIEEIQIIKMEEFTFSAFDIVEDLDFILPYKRFLPMSGLSFLLRLAVYLSLIFFLFFFLTSLTLGESTSIRILVIKWCQS